MHKPEKLNERSFYDITMNGWDHTERPDLTRRNFELLISEHNNLVEIVNELVKRTGLELGEAG